MLTFTTSRRQWLILCCMLLGNLVTGGGFIGVFGQTTTLEKQRLVDAEDEPSSSAVNLRHQRQLQQQYQQRLLNNDNNQLKQRFQVAKAKMIQKLEQDYGVERFHEFLMTDYYNATTSTTTTQQPRRVTQGRRFFVSPSVPKDKMATHENEGPSWKRLVDRMAMKILQAQLQLQYDSGNTNKMVPFVWATGGHSSAAGHGNYYNESYSFTLEQTAKGVFEAVGLDLVGRNYAMGGTSSGKEVASCTKEIFGLDMDVLSWDFGMTDGRSRANMEYYFYRASLSPSRPALFAFQAKFGREDALKSLENMGLTTLFEYGALYDTMNREGMPTCDGKTAAQVEEMPPMVRDCSCTAANGCVTAKWSKYGNPLCDSRKFQTSWHPGWKWHGLVGNFIALGLMEALEDAVNMIETQGSDPQALLKQLQEQQDTDYKLFSEGPIPKNAKDAFKINKEDKTPLAPTDLDLDIIYKGPNICHTARLPAETRYLGILTESDKTGFYDYDTGIAKDIAASAPPVDGLLPLTFDPSERQTCPYANMDYKDWFHVHGGHGWSKLLLPNTREAQEYGPQQQTWNQQQQPTAAALKGYVAMCMKTCPWGKCAKNYVNGIEDNKSAIKVNDQEVTELTRFGDCRFLKGKQGHVWPPNAASGKWEVSFQVTAPGDYMAVSAIIIW